MKEVVIKLGFYEVIELGFSYRYFDGCSDGKLGGLVTGVQYCINSGVGWFVDDRLGTGLYGDVDLITLGIENLLSVSMMAIFRVVWQETKMVSIMVPADVFMVS